MLWQSRYRLPSNVGGAGQPSGSGRVLPDRRQIRDRRLIRGSARRSAQESANPEHAAQTRCQPAAHRQGMTIWRDRPGGPLAAEIATRCNQPVLRGKMGRISSSICFILALLTVLSVDAGIPAVLRMRILSELSSPAASAIFWLARAACASRPWRSSRSARSFCSPMSLCCSDATDAGTYWTTATAHLAEWRAGYSLTGIHISSPPLPVSGSNFSS